MAKCPRLYIYMPVTNVCARVAYFLYISMPAMYIISALISCVADPSWSLNLRALYSASGLYTQPPGSTTPWYSSCYHVYMCARVVLTSRAGTIPSLRAAFSSMLSIPNLRVTFSLRALILLMVGEPSTQRSIVNSVQV